MNQATLSINLQSSAREAYIKAESVVFQLPQKRSKRNNKIIRRMRSSFEKQATWFNSTDSTERKIFHGFPLEKVCNKIKWLVSRLRWHVGRRATRWQYYFLHNCSPAIYHGDDRRNDAISERASNIIYSMPRVVKFNCFKANITMSKKKRHRVLQRDSSILGWHVDAINTLTQTRLSFIQQNEKTQFHSM
jgi:hypothetical protein